MGRLISKFSYFSGKKLLPGILMGFLAMLTIGTSVIGIGKVAGSFSSGKLSESNLSQQEVKGDSANQRIAGDTIGDGSVAQNESSNAAVSQNNTGKLQGNNSVLAAVATPQVTIANSSGGGGSCVITLFGKQYNVTNLLTTHSGGNVFACGTDMSGSYQSRHGTSVTRMQAYLIGGNSNSSTPTPTPTPVPMNNTNNGTTPTPTPTPTSSSGGTCIVTIFGKQYNIAGLLSSHSGGNVFACGTDMSASYQNQHGTNMSRMQSYLIASGATPTPTSTPVPTPTPTPTNVPTPTPTRTPSGVPTPTPTKTPTPTPTSAPTPTKTPTPTPTPTPTGCIVTLFGKQYEITSLLRSHSGGNVFNCGTDMSTVYQKEHGTNMSRMQRYLIP